MERIYSTLARIDEAMAGKSAQVSPITDGKTLNEGELELLEKTEGLIDRFKEAMDDDFNTALALGNLFDVLRCINKVLGEASVLSERTLSILTRLRSNIQEIGNILGIGISVPSAYLERIRNTRLSGLDINEEEIRKLIEERAIARKNRDFKRSDEIRDLLITKNIILLDSAQGTSWKVK
jgi:cysteinyl-tRNA synthetase